METDGIVVARGQAVFIFNVARIDNLGNNQITKVAVRVGSIVGAGQQEDLNDFVAHGVGVCRENMLRRAGGLWWSTSCLAPFVVVVRWDIPREDELVEGRISP